MNVRNLELGATPQFDHRKWLGRRKLLLESKRRFTRSPKKESLVGMGASMKRREARKRKFGNLQSEGVLQKEELDQNMRTSPSQDTERTQALDHPKAVHTLNEAETDDELLGKATPPKTNGEAHTKHRLICFIGTSHDSLAWKAPISKWSRESTLHGHNPIYYRALYRRETELYPSQHRKDDWAV